MAARKFFASWLRAYAVLLMTGCVPLTQPRLATLPQALLRVSCFGRNANGGISIGIIPPLKECVAVAHEGRNTLAMLKRRKDESLAELLSRLDLAIARAQHCSRFHGRQGRWIFQR